MCPWTNPRQLWFKVQCDMQVPLGRVSNRVTRALLGRQLTCSEIICNALGISLLGRECPSLRVFTHLTLLRQLVLS